MINCKSCGGEIRIYVQAAIEYGYYAGDAEGRFDFLVRCNQCHAEIEVSGGELGIDVDWASSSFRHPTIDITALVNK